MENQNSHPKRNYDAEMLEVLENNRGKSILLHSCCGPCSSYVIRELCKYLRVTVLYYNPNIEPKEEYERRKQEQIRIIGKYQKEMLVDYLDCDYENEVYEKEIKGFEREVEGGSRCSICFRLRLAKTAHLAFKNYDFFGTTLTVSPHKNAEIINQIGLEIENEVGVFFLVSDFKKREGYKKSIMYSKEYNLYRQEYCGCIYSKRKSPKMD